jgi:hypothetical protein
MNITAPARTLYAISESIAREDFKNAVDYNEA